MSLTSQLYKIPSQLSCWILLFTLGLISAELRLHTDADGRVYQVIKVEPKDNKTVPTSPGFVLPQHDQMDLAYNGDGDLSVITYKKDGVTVGTQNLTYVGRVLTSISVTLA